MIPFQKSRAVPAIRTALSLAALTSSLPGQLLIYEPFDYPATGQADDDNAFLGDGNQTGGFGLEDAWTSEVERVEMEVWDPGLTFTDAEGNELPVAGHSLFRTARGGFVVASRPVSPEATAALTADNSTMWMSFLYVDHGFSGPDSSVILASEPFTLANNHNLAAPGYGVGILVGETGQSTSSAVETGYYLDTTGSTRIQSGLNPNDFENETFLLAAKVNWNPEGTPDEIFIFNITDLSQEPSEEDAIASDSFDMPRDAQASLDTLNIGETQIDGIDEIRFGKSFADVVASDVTVRIAPTIASFTPLAGPGWQLEISGTAEESYEIDSAPDLRFESATAVENLSQSDPSDPGSVGGPNDTVVTLDDNGTALIELILDEGSRNFIRLQSVEAP